MSRETRSACIGHHRVSRRVGVATASVATYHNLPRQTSSLCALANIGFLVMSGRRVEPPEKYFNEYHHLAQDSSVSFLGCAVTNAGRRLQSTPIENGDLAATVPDQLPLFEHSGGGRNSLAAHAEHVGHELLSDEKLIAVRTIAGHQ